MSAVKRYGVIDGISLLEEITAEIDILCINYWSEKMWVSTVSFNCF